MGDRATFRTKFELEKRHHSHSDIRSKVVKSQPKSQQKMESSSPSMEMEEMIKHMKHLPNYLENGKHDRALSFGVMDWGRLQKWQDQNQIQNHKHEFLKTNKYSSSSSNSSLLSTDGSSPLSSQSQSQSQPFSPASQKVNRVTLQFHFQESPNYDFTQQIVHKTPETKNSNPFKIPDIKTRNTSRSLSPLRRLSFSSKSAGPTERPDSPVSNRAHSSPLRRLLDPIFPSKAKAKLDFENEIRVNDDVSSSSSSSRKQALFQTTVKNDRLLFTFAVENNDILAATLTNLTSSGKTDAANSIYTFFTVHEVKKKNGKWLSHGTKSKEIGYVPNVTAQMKVSSSSNAREFVLYSVNSSVQPQEELEAIVVKFSKNRDRFNTTIVLPGGSHGVPSKGVMSSLTDRWRSGGVCDCGGWDEGCKIKTLTNRNNGEQFELFVNQGEDGERRAMFSMSILKEGIYSVEYNSSLSDLHAFSICISVVECLKGIRTNARVEVPLMYTPIPRIKKNVVSL